MYRFLGRQLKLVLAYIKQSNPLTLGTVEDDLKVNVTGPPMQLDSAGRESSDPWQRRIVRHRSGQEIQGVFRIVQTQPSAAASIPIRL
jgi:hypothetical protein